MSVGKNGFKWNKSPPDHIVQNEFEIKSGLKPSVNHCTTIIDFFFYIINTEMINQILDCTNKKILLKNKNAKALDTNDICGYIGLLLFFGVNNSCKYSRNMVS